MSEFTGKQKIRVEITLDVDIAKGEHAQGIVQELDYDVRLSDVSNSVLRGMEITSFRLVDPKHPEL